MNRTQIDIVRHSFAQLQPVATQAAALFYDKLFERDPTVSPLFKGDMSAQGAKLMTMIGAAVALLERPAQLNAALAELGARHAGYGVRDEHYASVGGALLDTLAAALGDAFTPEVRAAWAAMYAHVAQTMKAAAQAEAALP